MENYYGCIARPATPIWVSPIRTKMVPMPYLLETMIVIDDHTPRPLVIL